MKNPWSQLRSFVAKRGRLKIETIQEQQKNIREKQVVENDT